MKLKIEAFLDLVAPAVKTFWLTGKETPWNAKLLQDHADYIYTRVLLGDSGWYIPEAVTKYKEVIKNAPLAGKEGVNQPLLPHLTAYVLASLNLLAYAGADVRAEVLSSIKLDLNKLVDAKTQLPIWPEKWSHHTWRVSHWIGGIPSILMTFSRHDPKKQVSELQVLEILEACDKHILQSNTGLMRAYRSELLQQLFRLAYRLRHSPEHGDIGGLVHIHWVNHVAGRPYIAADKLIERCETDLDVDRFLEKMPYCLDFDYIQLIRTALEQRPKKRSDNINQRVSKFNLDLVAFFYAIPDEGYSLHKLPGALATLHETSLLLGMDKVSELDIPPLDIIKQAYWL
ncbi:hypothetical protein [Rheinheimera tangshanensis]|uniref:Uncharacterized protein n=1 Tax=Rheinheimera tangshanensis TaxID=400153 RepID=A0A5C8LZM2_9GAMM|nr:hypothetical protein [Rheinheimera tangshanensis]TXK80560.1 hypothetical protein FU839_11450 [Rheinheimera tangshanensis]GGM60314.1 hypothetical protein GCM10010920_21210 [Rheinheimera tangshanensis]